MANSRTQESGQPSIMADHMLRHSMQAAGALAIDLRQHKVEANTVIYRPDQDASPSQTPPARFGWRLAFHEAGQSVSESDHTPVKLLLLSDIGRLIIARVNYPTAALATFEDDTLVVAEMQADSTTTVPSSASQLAVELGWSSQQPTALSDRMAALSARHAVSLSQQAA